MDASVERRTLRTGDGAQLVAIPGILARVQDQTRPIMHVLKEHDRAVVGLNYTGSRFDPNPTIKEIVEIVEENILAGRETILFGISLGGMLTAKALEALVARHGVATLNKYVRTIIVDAPSRGTDLVLLNPAIPVVVNVLAHGLTKLLRSPSSLVKSLNGKRLDGMAVGPKRDETELIPGGVSFEEIDKQAIAGLSGHLMTVWYDQVRLMLGTKLNLSALDGLNITYMANTANNVTIRQPRAMKRWAPHVKRLVNVPKPHASFLQAQITWPADLRDALR